MKAKKGIVSAGHKITAETAIEILNAGGNAYDAAVGALLTSFVAEPCMSSAGGGGFLLAHTSQGKDLLFDFFCQTPKRKKPIHELEFYPVELNFGDARETFHIGAGSIAVPGSIAGIFDIHKNLCTMPLSTLAEPAIKLAKEGVPVDDFQHYDFVLLENIIRKDKQVVPRFFPDDKLISEGKPLAFPKMADYFEYLTKEGPDAFYQGEVADNIVNISMNNGGFLTKEDLKDYKTHIRKPHLFDYRGYTFLTNALPSSGGYYMQYAFQNLSKSQMPTSNHGEEHLSLLCKTMKETSLKWKKEILDPLSNNNKRGCTTHFSILDMDGNAASISSTNGEGCGWSVPGTEIMLNNMLGEAALFPNGFHSWPEDHRVSSLMTPTIVLNKEGKAVIVAGSGGAGRIPAVIMQSIHYMLDFNLACDEAINLPRIYIDKQKINIEPGFDVNSSFNIPEHQLTFFKEKDMYFGGVHSVTLFKGQLGGAGDKRRSGILLKN